MLVKVKDMVRTRSRPLAGMEQVPFKLAGNALRQFKRALKDGGETAAHQVLHKYPSLMRDTMPYVGHHGMWFHDKPQIRPPLTNGEQGKIPDFLLAGRGSGGLKWFIIELKAPSAKLFNKNCTAFSDTANKGLNQLGCYLRYANEAQGGIRDLLEIKDFGTPSGILVIGREDETLRDEVRHQMKTFWNRNLGNIEIISYDKILKTAQERL